MGLQSTFHAPGLGTDFLGVRTTRTGGTEIVYDDGAKSRMIWRVASGQTTQDSIVDALSVAVSALRVLPTLYDELKKRAIAIERVGI